ncbi:hypothetical protein [Nocardia jiangsuensis]|uniref:Uncharacterized protein n=1 Tax=Nocardia jiangsuensis TaxID=1691563 RepID=A0ABV8DPE6_9NOCA
MGGEHRTGALHLYDPCGRNIDSVTGVIGATSPPGGSVSRIQRLVRGTARRTCKPSTARGSVPLDRPGGLHFSDSYGVSDGDIEFSLGIENEGEGPVHLYSTVSVPLTEVEWSPGGWPEFALEPSAGAGITTPAPPARVPRPGVRLYAVRLAPREGRRGEVRVRAHGYRIADDAVWFHFESPRPGERFDIASLSVDLLDGDPSAAVTRVDDHPGP